MGKHGRHSANQGNVGVPPPLMPPLMPMDADLQPVAPTNFPPPPYAPPQAYIAPPPYAPQPARQPSIREMLAASQPRAPQYADIPQPYPPGPYPAAPYPQHYAPFDPRYKKRRMHPGLIALIAVVCVVLAVAFGYVSWFASPYADGGSASRTLVLPDSIDGYASGGGDALASQMVQRETTTLGDNSSQTVPAGTVLAQVYMLPNDSTSRVVVLALHVPAIPRANDQLHNEGLVAAMNSFESEFSSEQSLATGRSVHFSPVDPGSQGGVMRCGAGFLNGLPIDECLWGDNSYFAATLVTNPDGTNESHIARDLRNAAEH